jgi:energy-coupling factor transporter ATP-binding protein EcfA2
MNHQDPPLLEARNLRWILRPNDPVSYFRARGKSAYFLGTKQLIDALISPRAHLISGEWLCRGQAVNEALRAGELAVCPSVLPVPRSTRLLPALTMSARLLGRSQRDALRSLEEVGLENCAKSSLAQLSKEQERRAGIAHGLITSPQVLIFAQPFSGLSDRARQDMSRLMERVTTNRSWIVAGESSCPVSRTWQEAADSLVTWREGQLRCQKASEFAEPVYFLRLKWSEAFETSGSSDTSDSSGQSKLAEQLRAAGAVVTATFQPSVLLVEALSQKLILEQCARFSACQVLAVEPAEEAGFRGSHARSNL